MIPRLKALASQSASGSSSPFLAASGTPFMGSLSLRVIHRMLRILRYDDSQPRRPARPSLAACIEAVR